MRLKTATATPCKTLMKPYKTPLREPLRGFGSFKGSYKGSSKVTKDPYLGGGGRGVGRLYNKDLIRLFKEVCLPRTPLKVPMIRVPREVPEGFL